jgi:acetyl esterase/lipase
MFHLEGMPPLCLLHGKDDELVPFNQSVMLDQELTRRGMPHEFYGYEVLKHYFSTSADNTTTQQMFPDSLGCLRNTLASEWELTRKDPLTRGGRSGSYRHQGRTRSLPSR